MNLTVDIRAEEFLARLRGANDRLSQNMVRVVTRLSVEVQSAVKEKLTGGVLHVRTGTLRRSINRTVVQDGTNVTATIGTNVVYAGVHEYGFNGVVAVPAFVRNAPTSAGIAARKAGTSGGSVEVRAHSRHMVMPARSYLRSTLADLKGRIQTDIKKAAMEALKA